MLVVLVVGHEYGHLLAAKSVGMRVLEFGVGFPPKLWGKKFGETEYTINALPFGGFVKIFGEDPTQVMSENDAFSSKSKLAQAFVLFAGPFANILIAFALFAMAFMVGLPAVAEEGGPALSDTSVRVAEVLPGSPAEEAGIMVGDKLFSVRFVNVETLIHTPEDFLKSIESSPQGVTLLFERGGEMQQVPLVPRAGLIPDDPTRPVVGIASAVIGIQSLSFFDAIVKSVTYTIQSTEAVFIGLVTLIAGAVTFSADLSGIAGPVGIASLVGDASLFGFGSILSLAAIISINLAIINLLPFPALDGGRLAFLGVEAISRRKIPLQVANVLNIAGFAILILLMIAVTTNDVIRLVS